MEPENSPHPQASYDADDDGAEQEGGAPARQRGFVVDDKAGNRRDVRCNEAGQHVRREVG